jgi:thiamine kinase-like enzyme
MRIENVTASTVYTSILSALQRGYDDGRLATKHHECHKLLQKTKPSSNTIEIVGGAKNFHRDPSKHHFARADGCWFDFAITLKEANKTVDFLGFDFEIRFPEMMSVKFLRFDLNFPEHNNEERGLRFHIHPGHDDLMIHAPPMSPLEILQLFIYGLEIPDKLRQ